MRRMMAKRLTVTIATLMGKRGRCGASSVTLEAKCRCGIGLVGRCVAV
jgi:hypothetical protein